MNVLQLYINLDWLKVFYLIGALIALTIAILVYPTMRYGPKRRKTSTKR